jgi:hypothetical protein
VYFARDGSSSRQWLETAASRGSLEDHCEWVPPAAVFVFRQQRRVPHHNQYRIQKVQFARYHRVPAAAAAAAAADGSEAETLAGVQHEDEDEEEVKLHIPSSPPIKGEPDTKPGVGRRP